MKTPRYTLPYDVADTIMVCALRFDGYKWLEAKLGRGAAHDFTPWTQPVIETLEVHSTLEENFVAFFALQRWLHKWGGEMLPESAPDHTAYRFLFLHLHAVETPERFIHDEYQARWLQTNPKRVAHHASLVRRALLNPFLLRKIV